MTRIVFQQPDGTPLGGATVTVSAAPGEMTDIGYVTDDGGGIDVPVTEAGAYTFTLNSADGNRLVADATLDMAGETTVAARLTG